MNIDLAGKKYKKPTSVNSESQNKDLSKSILILVLIIILIWGGVLFFKKRAIALENERFKNSIEVTSKSIKDLANSENPAKKIATAKSFKITKDNSVIWSEVMSKIIKLETPGISFKDFSVTNEGQVEGIFLADKIASVRQFVIKLNLDDNASNIALSQISKSAFTGGLEVSLKFNLKI